MSDNNLAAALMCGLYCMWLDSKKNMSALCVCSSSCMKPPQNICLLDTAHALWRKAALHFHSNNLLSPTLIPPGTAALHPRCNLVLFPCPHPIPHFVYLLSFVDSAVIASLLFLLMCCRIFSWRFILKNDRILWVIHESDFLSDLSLPYAGFYWK